MPGYITQISALETVSTSTTLLSAGLYEHFSGTLAADGTISLISALFGPGGPGINLINANGIALSGSFTYANPGNASTLHAPSLYGVELTGGGTFLNFGTVSNTAYEIIAQQFAYPSGTLHAGVFRAGLGIAAHGGAIINADQATVSGREAGILLENGTYLVNDGSIAGLENPSLPITQSYDFTGNFPSFSTTTLSQAYAGEGVSVNNALGSILNAGVITGASGIAITGGENITNSGLILGTLAGIAQAADHPGALDILDSGTLAGAQSATFLNGGETFFYAPALEASGPVALTLQPGAVITGAVITNPSYDNLLELEAGGAGYLNLATQNRVSGTTGQTISYTGFSFSNFGTIDFAPGASWTLAGDSTALLGGQTLVGFNAGDTLILENFAASAATFTPGAGLVLAPGATLGLTGSFAPDAFFLTAEGDDTEITEAATCFCPGTRIRTPHGDIPVEHLRVGDTVLTLHGMSRPILWIGTRAFAGRFAASNPLIPPIRIAAHAIGHDIPCRELWVSPGHALFIEGALIPAWRLINGVTINQARNLERVEYFHLELDGHDVLLAENCPAESYLDVGDRNIFANAASFIGISGPRPGMARTESGFLLENIRQKLARRAGIAPKEPSTGPLRGFIDEAGPDDVAGWAQDVLAPETPVPLEIFSGGQRLGQVLANAYRADLRQAGLGSGCHAFTFALPPGVSGALSLRRLGDGAPLTSGSRRAA